MEMKASASLPPPIDGAGALRSGSGSGTRGRLGAAALLLAVLLAPAYAVQPDEVLKDPILEHRAREISAELRCLVCQNQSIDDSDAPLAKDLRLIVRERLEKGDSDTSVLDYVVARYGEFVLLRPVFALHTLLLWLTPVLAVLLGGFGIWRLARRRVPATGRSLSAAEEAEVAALLRRE
jgi:cytochrome c-type biogenesis protein CcmH